MIPRDHPVVEGECDVGQGGRQAVRGGPDDALQLGTPVIAQIARDAALERRQTGERLVLMGAQHVARRFRGARDRDRVGGEEGVSAQRALRRAIEKEEVGESAEANAGAEGVGSGNER